MRATVKRIDRDAYLRLIPDARARLIPSEETKPVGDYIFYLGRKPEEHQEMVDWLREMEVGYLLQPSNTGLFVEFVDDAAAVVFMMRFA